MHKKVKIIFFETVQRHFEPQSNMHSQFNLKSDYSYQYNWSKIVFSETSFQEASEIDLTQCGQSRDIIETKFATFCNESKTQKMTAFVLINNIWL